MRKEPRNPINSSLAAYTANKSLLDRTSNHPGAMDAKVVLPLVRAHASIIAGSAPNAAMTFTDIPSDSRSTLTNEEWRTTPSYDLVSLWPATTTNRLHRARMAASSRRPSDQE